MFNKLKSFYRRVSSDIILGGACLFIAYSTMVVYAPHIEGKLYPVTVNTEIVTLSRAPDGNSMVSVTFENVRDCVYRKLTWYRIDDRGRLQSAYVNFLEDKGRGSRGLGVQKSQTWYVQMPTEVLERYSVAKVRHSCHELWDTETQFYP